MRAGLDKDFARLVSWNIDETSIEVKKSCVKNDY
jgi:hypothetical protein